MPNASAISQQDRGALDKLKVKGDGLSNQYAKGTDGLVEWNLLTLSPFY